MRTLVAFLFLIPPILYVLFQPQYDNMQFTRGIMLQQVVDRYIKEVAIEGKYTTEAEYGTNSIEYRMKQELIRYKFDPTKAIIGSYAMGARTPRGQYVNLEIQYPRGKMFVFANFWGASSLPSNYVIRAEEMSEYIP